MNILFLLLYVKKEKKKLFTLQTRSTQAQVKLITVEWELYYYLYYYLGFFLVN